jgi:hypothetical protein
MKTYNNAPKQLPGLDLAIPLAGISVQLCLAGSKQKTIK